MEHTENTKEPKHKIDGLILQINSENTKKYFRVMSTRH